MQVSWRFASPTISTGEKLLYNVVGLLGVASGGLGGARAPPAARPGGARGGPKSLFYQGGPGGAESPPCGAMHGPLQVA